jgi:fumarate reductase flavoprotein subunit
MDEIIDQYMKNARDISADVSHTIACDVLIVGSGPSGLTAAVHAKELGLEPAIIEVNEKLGGNGEHTEGVFAINSVFQKEQGIHITLQEIIEVESKTFNYHIDTLKWKDLVNHSGDNISWLLDHGVGFSGVVDECKGNAKIRPYHGFIAESPMGAADGNLLI